VSQLDEEAHWFQADALGSTLGLTTGGGGLSDTFLYEAFGTGLGRVGTTETALQYGGGNSAYTENVENSALLNSGPTWQALDAGLATLSWGGIGDWMRDFFERYSWPGLGYYVGPPWSRVDRGVGMCMGPDCTPYGYSFVRTCTGFNLRLIGIDAQLACVKIVRASTNRDGSYRWPQLAPADCPPKPGTAHEDVFNWGPISASSENGTGDIQACLSPGLGFLPSPFDVAIMECTTTTDVYDL